MIILYLLTLFMIVFSFQENTNVKKYLIVFMVFSLAYFFLSVEIMVPYKQNDYLSFYDYLLSIYFPYIIAMIISFYIRYEIEKKAKIISKLETNVNTYHEKIQNLIHISERTKREKNDLEKRLISEEKESIKIREIMTKINNFSLLDIEKNVINFLKKIVPTAEMRFYKNEEGNLKYIDSTKKNSEQNLIKNDDLYNYIFSRDEDISSSLDYKDRFKEKIIITLRLGKNEIFGTILIDDIDFFSLNKVTIQSLYYFTELLSLHIEKSLIFQKQKETSYSYNYKNIYNIFFLKKILYHELNTAKRHNLDSAIIKLTSKDFMDKNEDVLFDDIEDFYGKYLRKTDLVFYNQEERSFIFVFPITKIEKVKFIKEKIVSNLSNYYLKVNSYYITKNKQEKELFLDIGIK